MRDGKSSFLVLSSLYNYSGYCGSTESKFRLRFWFSFYVVYCNFPIGFAKLRRTKSGYVTLPVVDSIKERFFTIDWSREETDPNHNPNLNPNHYPNPNLNPNPNLILKLEIETNN